MPRVYKSVDDMTDDELLDALGDPHWRLRNLYKIKTDDEDIIAEHGTNIVPFVPNEPQEQFLEDIWYRNVIPKARQRGFTTLMQVLMLDYCLFEENFACAFIALNLKLAKKVLRNKLKFTYNQLPDLVKRMVPIKLDNADEIVFANGSSVYVAASPRGDTIQFLHVSELGMISIKYPDHAEEIASGGFETVAKSGIIVIESTVDSAAGLFPDMVRQAQHDQQTGKKLSQGDYKLHFASWWDADKYEEDPEGVDISTIQHAYFERMEAEIGRPINMRKRAWYVTKLKNSFQGNEEKMKQQYPTTLEEAFEVSTDGLWLSKQLASMRTKGRLTDVPYNPNKPVNFFWDLGIRDDMAIWCHQDNGDYDNFINFIEGHDEPYSYYIEKLQALGFGVWGTMYLPHDGNKRHQGAHVLKTPKDMLHDLGVRDIVVLPRIDSLITGIQELRAAFPRYRIDKTNCADGVAHLDSYSKVWDGRQQVWKDRHAENGHQHAADSLRQHAQMRHNIEILQQHKQRREARRNESQRTKDIRNRRRTAAVS